MNGITKETFLSVKGDARDAMLFDMLEALYTEVRRDKKFKWMDRIAVGVILMGMTATWAWVASWFT